MQFKKRDKRNYWINATLGSIPEILIALGFAINADNDGLVVFFGVLFGLYAIYLAIWLKSSIWNWVMFKFRNRELLTKTYLNYLIANDYPQPSEFYDGASEYFEEIALNTEQPVELRVKAAVEAGGIGYVTSSSQVQTYLRMTMALEDALEQYKRRF